MTRFLRPALGAGSSPASSGASANSSSSGGFIGGVEKGKSDGSARSRRIPLAGARQVAGDDELEAAPFKCATLLARLGAARLVETDLGPALTARGLAVPVGLAVSDERDRHVMTARSRAGAAGRGDTLSGSAAACRRARLRGASPPRSLLRAGCCRGSRWPRTP